MLSSHVWCVSRCTTRKSRTSARAAGEAAGSAAACASTVLALRCRSHWELVWGPVYRNLSEPSLAPVLDAAKAAYLSALTAVADRLVALKALRPALDRTAAVDLLWFYLGRQAWYTLVGDRRWDFDRAEAWLADAARHALLYTP